MIQKIPSPQQKFNDKPEQILIFLMGVRKIMHALLTGMRREGATEIFFCKCLYKSGAVRMDYDDEKVK